ncbi:MAG: sulfite exporter TauE/SafE family protein [Flavobacteriales bacterium]|nr:sulfite exporter TauE/SafE family protein [Flavobacteriales bacterium]
MSELWLPLGLAIIAFLYASVGHGGASGYITLLTLAGVASVAVRPSSLMLNLCVSAIAFIQFARAGHFRWKVFWPFAILSIPMAWVGAGATLDPALYRKLLALCLVFAVARMTFSSDRVIVEPRPMAWPVAVIIGLVIGLVSGLIGIGGGIILSPILLLAGWADAKTTAATSALFIFVNSAAGLLSMADAGHLQSLDHLSWPLAAIGGGVLGSWVGARKLIDERVRQALGIVLFLAAIKLWWT